MILICIFLNQITLSRGTPSTWLLVYVLERKAARLMVKILIAAQAINLASETQRTFQDGVGFTMFAW